MQRQTMAQDAPGANTPNDVNRISKPLPALMRAGARGWPIVAPCDMVAPEDAMHTDFYHPGLVGMLFGLALSASACGGGDTVKGGGDTPLGSACKNAEECVQAAACVNNVCTALCIDRDSCGENEWCVSGYCRWGCTQESDCDDGEECTTDTCGAAEICEHLSRLNQACTVTTAGDGQCSEPDAVPVCKLVLGQGCATGAVCASGLCAQGVCCGSACAGNCQQCNAVGHEGT
ncbi:MAG: hypothetical protein AAB426_12330, partial [Myxococcota bacterium]